MKGIKVIKRRDIEQLSTTRQDAEVNLRHQVKEVRRNTANAVTEWIAEWRQQKQKGTADALAELLRLTSRQPEWHAGSFDTHVR